MAGRLDPEQVVQLPLEPAGRERQGRHGAAQGVDQAQGGRPVGFFALDRMVEDVIGQIGQLLVRGWPQVGVSGAHSAAQARFSSGM